MSVCMSWCLWAVRGVGCSQHDSLTLIYYIGTSLSDGRCDSARRNGPGSSEKKGEDGDGDTRKTGNVVSRIAESMRRKTSEGELSI